MHTGTPNTHNTNKTKRCKHKKITTGEKGYERRDTREVCEHTKLDGESIAEESEAKSLTNMGSDTSFGDSKVPM
jgi:hypothetical protein